jgi:phage terminase large subunit
MITQEMLERVKLGKDEEAPKNVFKPLPWQVDPWRSKANIVVLAAGAGNGKSRLAAEKIHAYCMKYPGVTAVALRKDRTAANKSIVPFLLNTVMGGTSWGTYLKTDGLFEYKNGSQLWIAGVRDESQRQQLRSIGKDGAVDFLWAEEANKLQKEDDNEIAARMRGTKGGYRQRIYTTNPDAPTHWLKTDYIDVHRGDYFWGKPTDNPYNPPDYFEELEKLTGVFRDRLWLGLWVQAEGVIYMHFDSRTHVLPDEVPTPIDGRYVVSVDFGFTHPFSASLWRINEDRIYQVSQIYKTKTLVEDHAKSIRNMITERGLTMRSIEAWVMDHDAEGRATLERKLGILSKPAFKDVTAGIDAVNSRFKAGTLFLKADAQRESDPDLEKMHLPLCTADEVPSYIWSDKKAETPVKEYDHGCDEMRYMVAYNDKLNKKRAHGVRTRVRSFNYLRGDVSRNNIPY